MSIFSKLAPAAVIAAGVISSAAPALSAEPAGAAASTGPRCFFINQWKGWKSPSPDVLYLGVTPNAVYKVTLSVGSPSLGSPVEHLISRARGNSSICTSLDLDLALSNGHGIEQPLVATSIRRLTPAEVAAIPPKYMPTIY
jgi:hypothetical protein